MEEAPRCSCDASTNQSFACRFLPLPVVLLPEAPLRGRDGGIQLLPAGAVVWTVWTSWPGAPSFSGCLQPEALASTREDGSSAAGHQRPLSPPGGLFHLHALPRPRGQRVALRPQAFCSGAGPAPPGGSKLAPGAWAQLARPMARALAWESGGHVSMPFSEFHCLTLGLSFLTDPWFPHL